MSRAVIARAQPEVGQHSLSGNGESLREQLSAVVFCIMLLPHNGSSRASQVQTFVLGRHWLGEASEKPPSLICSIASGMGSDVSRAAGGYLQLQCWIFTLQ